jgi:hypothetical protein
MTAILEQHAVQILLCVLIVYEAVRLLVFKDIDSIRPKEWGPVKEEFRDAYAREMGILILVFGLCMIGMAVISLYDGLMSLLFILLAIIVTFYRFNRIEKKYGNENHHYKG